VANLRALGADPVPVGVVGDDEAGHRLLAAFEALGISCRGIIVTDEFPTPTKSRIVAGGTHTRRQQVVRVDRGTRRRTLPGEVGRRLDLALDRALRRADGLLLADYGYGAATPERLRRLGRLPQPVFVDSRARVGAYRGVTACTPNQEELELSTGDGSLETDAAVQSAGKLLLRRTRARAILVTRGARGMCLVSRDEPPLHIPAFGSDEVADVTGAGDTVIATFTLALLAGADLADAARLANYAAGLVVMKAGTATVDATEILRALADAIEPEGAA
jgi:rfaE bifunctional protein kinase chain/domain